MDPLVKPEDDEVWGLEAEGGGVMERGLR